MSPTTRKRKLREKEVLQRRVKELPSAPTPRDGEHDLDWSSSDEEAARPQLHESASAPALTSDLPTSSEAAPRPPGAVSDPLPRACPLAAAAPLPPARRPRNGHAAASAEESSDPVLERMDRMLGLKPPLSLPDPKRSSSVPGPKPTPVFEPSPPPDHGGAPSKSRVRRRRQEPQFPASLPGKDKEVAPAALPERAAIERFGISFAEIVTKLVTDNVLSEAESRMVFLLLGNDAMPQCRQRMLEAVLKIENSGITRGTVSEFRNAVAEVTALVCEKDEFVRALADTDIHVVRGADAESTPLVRHPPNLWNSADVDGSADLGSFPSRQGTGLDERHAVGESFVAQQELAPTVRQACLKLSNAPPTEHDVVHGPGVPGSARSQHSAASDLSPPRIQPGNSLPELDVSADAGLSKLVLGGGGGGGGGGSSGAQSQVLDDLSDRWASGGGVEGQLSNRSNNSSKHRGHSGTRHVPTSWPPTPGTHSTASLVPDHRVPVVDQVLTKIAQRISELPREKLIKRKQVVLVGSGLYNPIHKLHLRLFYIARKHLEAHSEYEVLGGLVSPSHATEVRQKYRQRPKEIIPSRHRLAMARAAVGDSTWLTVDPWEITRRRVMDYLSVLDHVQRLFDFYFPEIQIKLMYLTDAEQLMKLSPQELRDHDYGTMCICRPRETDLLLKQMGTRWKQVAHVVEDAAILSRELEATTSGSVRRAAMAGARLDDMVGAPVAQYITKERLGAKMAGRERWSKQDKEFKLARGLDVQDQGYLQEPRKPLRTVEEDPGVKHQHPFEL